MCRSIPLVATLGSVPAISSTVPHVLSSFCAVVLFFMAAPVDGRAADGQSEVQVVSLQTEAKKNPLGIDARFPHLSWKLIAARRDVRQTAYQIRVTENEPGATHRTHSVFDSGKVRSRDSIDVAYAGSPLQSRHRYVWQVRVWDDDDRPSAWSEAAWWEMGLLSPSDWTAQWIDPGSPEEPTKPGPAVMLRHEFTLSARVTRARAYVSALGLYELYLNGSRVGDLVLTPGWTSYDHRSQYQTYDVTAQLNSGRNSIGAWLGDGWYRGTLGWKEMPQRRHLYGDRTALLAQIEVTYADGRTETIVSNGQWKAETGPILFSDIYQGEAYDARLERDGWLKPGYDDRSWPEVKPIKSPAAKLIAHAGPPIRRIQEIIPVKTFTTPKGEAVVDMGQNMVGWVRLRAKGPAGTTVTLRHAEVLDGEGNLYTENLRSAQQMTRYVLKGGAEEVFEPHFTYQGFRYVAVEGYPGPLTPESVTGIVVHSDMEPTGAFETSSPLLNQLQHNIVWSQKGNFVAVPTDCPQRDERVGWTADAQVFFATAAFNMDVESFFSSWLGDLAAEQTAQGAVPWAVPDVERIVTPPLALRQLKPDLAGRAQIPAAGIAGWSDAATVVPWNLYVAYGDTGVLAAQYESMKRWVAYQQAHAVAYIWKGLQFGDWLDFFSSNQLLPVGATSDELIATAYFAHSVDLLQRAAAVLGQREDVPKYRELLSHIRTAFVRRFVSADGHVGSDTQTAYVLALDFDLLPESVRPQAARHLAEDVRRWGHLTTGFLGTPHLLDVLTRFGYVDEAYRLLTRQEFPSWLYPVTRGATTIWERWDGIRPDGSFQNPGMNSFNHYAYGAVGEWMYRVVAGLNPDPAAPAYRHSIIAPQPGGGLTSASGTLETRYGGLASAWEIRDGVFHLSLQIPANTRATVLLPHARLAAVREGGQTVDGWHGISGAREKSGVVALNVGSGTYEFTYQWAVSSAD